MNNLEFIDEVVGFIKKDYEEFEAYQAIAIDILKEVDRVLKKHDVPYMLSNGTLLGFIRDNQNVPWDYDVDIATPFCYREKLLSALRESLGEDYYYTYKDVMDDYPATCLRVSRKGYNFMAIHVDVFFIIGMPSDDKKRNKMFKKVQRWTKIRTQKYIYRYMSPPNYSRIKNIGFIIIQFLYGMIPSSYLQKKEEKLCSTVSFDKATYCISFAYHIRGIELFPSDIFRNLKDLESSQGVFSIPIEYDRYLSIIFGDYHQYFPIKTRFEEYYNSKRIIDERQKYFLYGVKG